MVDQSHSRLSSLPKALPLLGQVKASSGEYPCTIAAECLVPVAVSRLRQKIEVTSSTSDLTASVHREAPIHIFTSGIRP